MPERWTRSLLHVLCGLLCAVAAGVVAGAEAAAQRWSLLTQISFQHLNQDSGLPNEIATAVAEDGQGFVWLGTLGGLARWDGYRVRVYRGDPKTAGALPDNVIQTLHGDAAGRLWIGTSAAGLLRHDPVTDRFVIHPAGPQGLSHVSVRAIADDGAGGLWVATDGGLDRLDPASGQVRRWPADGSAGLAGGRASTLLRDRQGRLWAGTPAGLFRLDSGSTRFEPVPLAATAQPEPVSLAEDSEGRLWIGTLHDGAFLIATPGSPAEALGARFAPAAGDALQGQQVVAIAEAQRGEVWLASAGQGIVAVDTSTRQVRHIRNVATLPVSLSDNAVRGLHRDRSGLVWAATNRGVSRHDPRQSAVLAMFGAPVAAQGDSTVDAPLRTEVSWILPTRADRIWLGTHKSGIDIVDPSGARVAALRPDAARPENALPQDIVLALERAPDGSVFIGTKRGLYRAREDGSGVARVRIGTRDPAASSWALLVDGERLWIGGQSDGVWQLDLRSGQAAPLAPALAAQLSDQRVIVLARGPGGTLWVGTRYGLNRVDVVAGTVQKMLPEPGRADGLTAGFITTLYTDRRQRLWVGTYGGGINVLESGSDPVPRWRTLGLDQGLPDNNVNALLEDAGGAVWVSTDNGLARIDPTSFAVRPLQRAEGVTFPTYWTGSASRTPEGELLFGGAGGMSIVRPERLQPWTYRAPVVVTDLRIGGQAVPAGAYLSQGGSAPPLVVDAEANSLAVEFSALDYSAPERNRYAYRLQGYDTDWVATDASRRLAAYTNLPPGDYRLLLRGSNRDGVWNEAPLQLAVHVLPAWHQTLWFRLGVLAAVLLAVFAVVRSRTRLLRARQAELERKVQERTAELEAMSRALSEKSRVLELSSLSDPLTGLRNRRLLTEQIDALVAASLRRAQDAPAGAVADTDNLFLLVDVDHFKRVNDLHGHAAGDTVLLQFGERLRSALRESDILVRWGGEEFLVVAHDTDRARAEALAERIRSSVEATPFIIDEGQRLAVCCSIGWACMPFVPEHPRAAGWQEVVKLADLALLAAKRVGRNTCVGVLAADRAQAAGLLARVQADPQAAVERDEIRLVCRHDPAAVMAALSRQGTPDRGI